MKAVTALLPTRLTSLQIAAGLLLTLLAGLPVPQPLAAGNVGSATPFNTASIVEHTIWTTPGELVNFRVTRELLYASAASDEQGWVTTLQGRPEAAQLLSNPDGSQSLLWVPVAADIGSWPLEFDVLKVGGSVGNSVERRKVRVQIEVLEGEVKLARLNSLPDLLITDSKDSAVQKDALVKAALREPLQFRVIAKDADGEAPLVSLLGESITVAGQNFSIDSGDNSAPTTKRNAASVGSLKADSIVLEGNTRRSGYQNFTVYAVDRKHPLQYVSQTINVLVGEGGPQRLRTSWIELEENPQTNSYPGYRRGPTSSAALAGD